nr:protein DETOXIFICATION 24-like [Tanacetum cinerariifolium]
MDQGIQTKLLRRDEEEEEGDLKVRIWDESKKIWRVALPGVISRVCAFGTIVVTQSFIGHISGLDLAGYALVQTLSVRFVNGILLGMSSATETLCGHAFGAGQHHMMGIYLQSLELWYNAVLVLLAGYMADAEVAISAFSICLNINAWEFMISLGFLGAACVRVANELGRGNAKAAKFSIKVLLGTSIAIGVFFFVLCLIFGRKLAYVFTDDERVADTVSDLSLLLSFSVLLNSIYPVLSGVAVGAGMQGSVAIVNLVCFYLIGIPIGALLGYLTSLEVKGIWIGMIGGVVTQTVALIYMAWTTDWDDQVKRATERLDRFYVKSSENEPQTH